MKNDQNSRTKKMALASTLKDVKESADDPLNKDLAINNTISDTALSSKSRAGTNQPRQSNAMNPMRRKRPSLRAPIRKLVRPLFMQINIRAVRLPAATCWIMRN